MRTRPLVVGSLLLIGICGGISGTAYLRAQDPSDDVRTGTMRPVIRQIGTICESFLDSRSCWRRAQLA